MTAYEPVLSDLEWERIKRIPDPVERKARQKVWRAAYHKAVARRVQELNEGVDTAMPTPSLVTGLLGANNVSQFINRVCKFSKLLHNRVALLFNYAGGHFVTHGFTSLRLRLKGSGKLGEND